MSFREKSAWVTVISILLVLALYVTHVRNPLEPDPGLWELHVAAITFAAFIVIDVIAHIVLYWRFWKDARTPKDERERLIDLKATRLAWYVFVVGTLIAIVTTPHHGASGFGVMIFVLFAFAIAEVVNYAARIVYYRRGV
jgi:uncharacterized membrane protein